MPRVVRDLLMLAPSCVGKVRPGVRRPQAPRSGRTGPEPLGPDGDPAPSPAPLTLPASPSHEGRGKGGAHPRPARLPRRPLALQPLGVRPRRQVGGDPGGGGPTLRRVPLAPVESARSLPARSTRLTLLTCGDTCVTRRSRDAVWAPASPGCGLQGPPSLGPERPTLRSTAALLSAPLRRRPPSPGCCTASAPGTWHPAVPCLLAARHLHITVCSTDQAHRVVGFEPGSGSPFPHCPPPPEPPGHWAGPPPQHSPSPGWAAICTRGSPGLRAGVAWWACQLP